MGTHPGEALSDVIRQQRRMVEWDLLVSVEAKLNSEKNRSILNCETEDGPHLMRLHNQ